jgi:hypothetical protein
MGRLTNRVSRFTQGITRRFLCQTDALGQLIVCRIFGRITVSTCPENALEKETKFQGFGVILWALDRE